MALLSTYGTLDTTSVQLRSAVQAVGSAGYGGGNYGRVTCYSCYAVLWCYGALYPRYILARNVDTAAAGHWCQVPPSEPGPVVTSYLLSLTYSAVALTTIQA